MIQRSKVAVLAKASGISILVGTIAFIMTESHQRPLAEQWLTLGAWIGIAATLMTGLYGCWLWLLGGQPVDKEEPLLLRRPPVAGGDATADRDDTAYNANGEEGSSASACCQHDASSGLPMRAS